MSTPGPPPALPTNPLRRIALDVRTERALRGSFPPGETRPSLDRTHKMIADPLAVLLPAYERHGPVFSVRILHARNVFVLGPEANHFVLVSNADAFRWRDGGFAELIPLLGDGLLTIDGDFHRRHRRVMLPAFHRERIAAAQATMDGETAPALQRLVPGTVVDLEEWSRVLALRIAMRALFGLDPDAAPEAARRFSVALSFYGREYLLQVLRGPGTPWARMRAARRDLDRLIYAQIARRRRTGERGEDILSMLLDATDEHGAPLSDQHVRDEVMTLLFAGHDTTTATICFLFHELARHPKWRGLEHLEQVTEETLRLYPPAWIGPRRAVRDFELHGIRVPAGAPVNYSSYASHRLPDVWEDPHAFRPERFAPEAKARIPRGAYVPFGGGSRTCIGMRFGQQEIRTIAGAIIGAGLTLDPVPGWRLRISQTPTLGPRGGMPVRVGTA